MYDHLTKDDDGPKYQRVWKARIPEKIKTFIYSLDEKEVTVRSYLLLL
jgi:hypothetical protein